MSKFKDMDADYFSRRKEFADRHEIKDFWHIADNWPLYSGYVNIGRSLAIYELIKKVIDLPGHFLELGTWNGSNLMFMAKMIHLLRPHALTELYGFDSFEGLTQFDEKDHNAVESAGNYKGNEAVLREMIALHKFDDFIHLVKGDIMDTLPRFIHDRPDIMFSFVYFDTDLYNSTKLGIELLMDRLVKGGIMVFDEYNMRQWPGETKAVQEMVGDRYELQTVPFTRQPTAYLVKS